MEPRKQMSRKTYKRTIGLLYLLCLIIFDFLYLFLPTDLEAQRWYGSATVFIPLVPLWVTSIITLLVWALLRLTVPLESLTDEERNRPLLRRLNYLQLFACTGTLIAAIWAVSSFFMQRLVTDAIQISGQDLINFYLFHIITIAFASALLYAGAHTRKIGLILLCFLFFIVTISLNWFGLITVLNVSYNTNNPCENSSPDEYIENDDPVAETDYMTGNVQEWEEMDDEPGLMDEAGNSLVHYCKEYIQNKPKAGLTFTANLLMDYHDLQQEKPDENYAAESHPWSDKMKWIDAGDCYPLYLLTSAILGQTDLNEDEVYETLCDQVLPVVVQELNDNNLYSGSQLETLINLLDYAYRDLQSPEDEKLAALYNEMASDDFLHLETADLFPYFTQPYAVLHSDCDDMQVIWAYSFWARRWNDGCISLCRRILDKILEIWPNKTCTTATMAKTEQYYRANRRNSNYSREELLQELENAFADAPRPEVETILLDEMEIGKRSEIGEIFRRYAWQEIPAATLYQNAEALSCFTPQGFRYYLPAFLSETIRNDNPEKNLLAPLLRSLTYIRMSPEYGWNHFAVFSSEQGKAVYHCLEWMAANHNDASVHSSQLQQATESWWLRYEE